MAAQTESTTEPRIPLTRERVLQAAVALADRDGIEALTMRNLAQELGVEAMSLYYHVANKEAVLDGIVEAVVGEINEAVGTLDSPSPEDDWKTAMRQRILTARQVLLRHKWAPAVMETRTTMSMANVYYYEGILKTFREGGFSYDLAHHAMHALGSRALGFTQELFDPGDAADEDASEALFAEMAENLPFLSGFMVEIAHDDPDSTLGWCDDQTEFEFGLDLILDGLDRLRHQ